VLYLCNQLKKWLLFNTPLKVPFVAFMSKNARVAIGERVWLRETTGKSWGPACSGSAQG